MKHFISVVFCLFLFARTPVGAQTNDFVRLDWFLEQVSRRIPSGFEVLIVHEGREVYWKAFGPWRRNQQAMIASATKWFSGAVIMSLVDDGILALDDRASLYLPYMTGEKEHITVRQLMSHTAGFGREFPLVHPCLADSSGTLEQCAEMLARVPLEAPAGTTFIYSGAGMQVAGRVAEVASGKDWQTLFRERIAGPLGMTSTGYDYEGPTQNPRISGGARSTVTGYMKFLTMLQQRGIYEGRRILSTRSVDEMLRDQVGDARIVASPLPENWRYGIGNWLEEPDSAGRTLRNSSIGVAGWTPLLDRTRNLQVVVGMQNVLRPFQPFYAEFRQILQTLIPPATLTPLGVTNAASYEAGPVAPDEMLAIFGTDLGPPAGISANAVNGSFPTTLAGTEVTFDGEPAALLYASSGQVIAIAPPSLRGKSTVEVQVISLGARSTAVRVPVSDSWPALFAADATARGQAAALNQDNSANTAATPAPPGTILQLFGAGLGTATPVKVFLGGAPAEISYAGPAPGLPGVFQINVEVPDGIAAESTVPIVVEAGINRSLPVVTVAVR